MRSASAAPVGNSWVRNSTTAPIPPGLSSALQFEASASLRSVSGVNTRVSLYPASLSKSSSLSYVFEVPRRWRGTLPRSGYLDLFVLGGGVEGPGGELEAYEVDVVAEFTVDCVRVGETGSSSSVVCNKINQYQGQMATFKRERQTLAEFILLIVLGLTLAMIERA